MTSSSLFLHPIFRGTAFVRSSCRFCSRLALSLSRSLSLTPWGCVDEARDPLLRARREDVPRRGYALRGYYDVDEVHLASRELEPLPPPLLRPDLAPSRVAPGERADEPVELAVRLFREREPHERLERRLDARVERAELMRFSLFEVLLRVVSNRQGNEVGERPGRFPPRSRGRHARDERVDGGSQCVDRGGAHPRARLLRGGGGRLPVDARRRRRCLSLGRARLLRRARADLPGRVGVEREGFVHLVRGVSYGGVHGRNAALGAGARRARGRV